MEAAIRREASEIVEALAAVLPAEIDGREAILELQRTGSTHWRQTEWIGFWFEEAAAPALRQKLTGKPGPRYGNTTFDYQRDYVWDLKAHPVYRASGALNSPMICNDQDAVDACIRQWGGLGFVIVHGHAVFDSTGQFKLWHDSLKRTVSNYEMERVARGAPSRVRKTALRLDRIQAVFFPSVAELTLGLRHGWVKGFQEGMRNSNGAPRRAKYALVTERIPSEFVIADRSVR